MRGGSEAWRVCSQSRVAGELVASLPQRFVLTLIRVYQVVFSPVFAGSCRYVPSCSAYAAEAITRFGVMRGSGLALRRLSRCHPFGGHGIDPVPAFASSERPPSGASQRRTSRSGQPASEGAGNQSL
jgi:putative membrane protein insertion efficiency factor